MSQLEPLFQLQRAASRASYLSSNVSRCAYALLRGMRLGACGCITTPNGVTAGHDMDRMEAWLNEASQRMEEARAALEKCRAQRGPVTRSIVAIRANRTRKAAKAEL